MNNQLSEKARFNNQRTVQSYEGYARKYAAAVSSDPSAPTKAGIRQMAEMAPNGTILEVGSGPGWDADFAEALGLAVRRTDVTQAFREFQQERGKAIEPLDILVDDFGGPYDGIMALCVLLNIDRDHVDLVLGKVSQALKPGGLFLVSVREGEGELWERSDVSGDYYVVLWDALAFVRHLTLAGLHVVWTDRSMESDGAWLTFLAQRIRSK